MPAGRPPIFETPEALQEMIDEFIQDKDETPTISGLAYYLGFESRQSFYDYEKREEFSYTIKRARLFIERHYEAMLITKTCVGSIFALKNMGWSDKQEIDQKTEHSGSIAITWQEPDVSSGQDQGTDSEL